MCSSARNTIENERILTNLPYLTISAEKSDFIGICIVKFILSTMFSPDHGIFHS